MLKRIAVIVSRRNRMPVAAAKEYPTIECAMGRGMCLRYAGDAPLFEAALFQSPESPMKTAFAVVFMATCSISIATAQQSAPPAIMSPAAQIASAVAPLPQEFRDGATILGYAGGTKGLTQLRAGT